MTHAETPLQDNRPPEDEPADEIDDAADAEDPASTPEALDGAAANDEAVEGEGDTEAAADEEAAEGTDTDAADDDDAAEGEDETADEDDDVEGDEDAEVDPEHVRLAEALLFASSEPLTERQLKNRLPEEADVKAVLKTLRGFYDGRGVELVKRGKSWGFRTAPDLVVQLEKEVEVQRRLSRAAIETLAVIAYHQPVTRAEIEDIRGVSLSKGTMDLLLEHGWIKPGARRESPGRPLTWRTTDAFLDHFGLESERELPGLKDLKAMGLLETGPALNVYRSRGEVAGAAPGEELPENRLTGEGDEEAAEPLDPDEGETGTDSD